MIYQGVQRAKHWPEMPSKDFAHCDYTSYVVFQVATSPSTHMRPSKNGAAHLSSTSCFLSCLLLQLTN